MAVELRRYRVRIGMTGITEQTAEKALPGMMTALRRRSHLGAPQIFWDHVDQRIVFEATVAAPGEQHAIGWIRDDLLQIAIAEVTDFDNLSFDVLNVRDEAP